MSHICKRTLLSLGLILSFSGPALADSDRTSCVIAGLTKDMPYDQARDIIIEAGFGPDQREYEDHECIFPRISSPAKFECDTYPERQACASTGQARCNMTFIDADRNRLLVGTIGEFRIVSSWRYDCSGYSSKPLSWSDPKSE